MGQPPQDRVLPTPLLLPPIPKSDALVLGTDGSLHVIDPSSGAVTARIPVIDEWEEPVEWQQPRPTLAIQGHTAYVTDPDNSSIHAVDLESGDVLESAKLPHVPNELTDASH